MGASEPARRAWPLWFWRLGMGRRLAFVLVFIVAWVVLHVAVLFAVAWGLQAWMGDAMLPAGFTLVWQASLFLGPSAVGAYVGAIWSTERLCQRCAGRGTWCGGAFVHTNPVEGIECKRQVGSG